MNGSSRTDFTCYIIRKKINETVYQGYGSSTHQTQWTWVNHSKADSINQTKYKSFERYGYSNQLKDLSGNQKINKNTFLKCILIIAFASLPK